MTRPAEMAALLGWRLQQSDWDVARAERRAAEAERLLEAANRAAAAASLAAGHALDQERARTDALQAELARLYFSTSWRISNPVRIAGRLMHALRNSPAAPLPPRPIDPPPAPVPVLLTPRESAILRRLQGSGQS